MSQAIGNTALGYARVWHQVDASERILGKLANRIAVVLMGKHKGIYDPGVDCGDYVIVTNARKVVVSGKKAKQKVYRHHTMYPGGLKTKSYRDMMNEKPDEILRQAVFGMLPKNKLRDRRLERLRIFPDGDAGRLGMNVLRSWEDARGAQVAPVPTSSASPVTPLSTS